MKTTCTHAATRKSSSAAKSATSTTAGKCVTGYQSHQDGRREADQTEMNHGILLTLERPAFDGVQP
jgi:hypothetical protein